MRRSSNVYDQVLTHVRDGIRKVQNLEVLINLALLITDSVGVTMPAQYSYSLTPLNLKKTDEYFFSASKASCGIQGTMAKEDGRAIKPGLLPVLASGGI